MGTNYYLLTKDLKYKDKLGNKVEITDTPFFAYSLHLLECGAITKWQHRKMFEKILIHTKNRSDT